MRVVIATAGLTARVGIHSYLDAILGEIVALDHEVHVVAPVIGRPEAIERAGAFAHTSFEDVPGRVDGVIAFLDFLALEARAAFPGAALLCISHGPWYAQDVPAADAAPCAAVALSDLSMQRLRQSVMAERGVPIVRLTQPAELRAPSAPAPNLLPAVPRHAVVVAHRLTTRREPLLEALRGRGIDVSAVGGADHDDDVLNRLLAADIVIGIGRVIVEGMAAGRACLVFDEVGGADWLTPRNYAEFEATGFLHGPGAALAPEDLGALIDGYRPELGRAGRELILRNHAPAVHAARLLELLHCAHAPAGPFDAVALREQASALRHRYERRVSRTVGLWDAAARERDSRISLGELQSDHARLQAELSKVRNQRDRARDELALAYRSRSWRLTAPLRRIAQIKRVRRARR